MDINTLTEQLIASRLMQTDEELAIFEDSLLKIYNFKDLNYIKNMCMGFHDDTECHDVMSDIVHAIESYAKIFSINDYLEKLLESTPTMLPHAKEWVERLNRKILNDENYYGVYKKIIKESDAKIKNIILEILVEIKDDSPNKFGAIVDEILFYVNESDKL